jgi:hypothetical protein
VEFSDEGSTEVVETSRQSEGVRALRLKAVTMDGLVDYCSEGVRALKVESSHACKLAGQVVDHHSHCEHHPHLGQKRLQNSR